MGNGPETSDHNDELERLRQRVLELEARLSSEKAFGAEGRERLLAEAERVARMGSFAWHVPTETIHWSDELYNLLGLDPAKVVPSLEAFFACVHPEDRGLVRDATSFTATSGIGDFLDFRIVRPDGMVRHIHAMSAPIPESDGRVTRFVGVLFDRTERVQVDAELRRREEALRAAQRIAKLGSFEWNPWTGRTVWSEGLHRICGVPLEQPGTPELYFSLVHPDDRPRLLEMKARVEAGGTYEPMEYRLVRADRTVIEVYAEAVPVTDAAGRPAGLVGTVLDITQRKRLEAQLLQSQKMDALGRLAGGIAHDFNNLLTIIGGQVELVRQRHDEPELAEVARAATRAAELTRQLLAFSRQSVLEPRQVDPVKTVREALKMMGRILGEDVELSFSSAATVGAVSVDPARLEQVLLNLLVNARDALPQGGKVTVALETCCLSEPLAETQRSLPPGEYVVLRVDDDGVGMDEAVRNRALEPFFTTKAPGRGTGLGLAMVFGIVSQSGGGVAISSAKGRGTSVRVLLPRLTVTTEAPAPPTPKEPARGPRAE